MGIVSSLQNDLQHLERLPAQTGVDTIRLWEANRDEANLWRAIAILLLPLTLVAAIGVVIMYLTADTEIEVPQRRPPHVFSVDQVPDKYFISVAHEVVNLIATYTPERARSQFENARLHLWEPALTQFGKEMLVNELRTISDTRRTQMFLADPALNRVDRDSAPDRVTVRVAGTRQKVISGQPLLPEEVQYAITMTTIPRNLFNEYGIVAVNIGIRNVSINALLKEEERQRAEEQKKARRRNRRRR